MLDGSDVALMRLAYAVSLNGGGTLPAGFTAMTNAGLALPTSVYRLVIYDQLSSGIYDYATSSVLAAVGTLNGVTTATLAFRDARYEEASSREFTNIAVQYLVLDRLVAAFDALVARQGITQVAVTGVGLGGSVA